MGTEFPRNDSFCTNGANNCAPDASELGNEEDGLSRKSTPNSTAASAAATASVSLNDQRRARQRSQAEARKKRKLREREREGVLATKDTLEAAKSDACDWKLQPFAIVKGQVCGIHYKVLGLDRKDNKAISKADIKRAYRQKSLAVHPDKNPSLEAGNAFKVVQDAYECLVSLHIYTLLYSSLSHPLALCHADGIMCGLTLYSHLFFSPSFLRFLLSFLLSFASFFPSLDR